MDINQGVRDLVWAVQSPSLITDETGSPPLDASQIDAEHLAAFLSRKSTQRVGRYFENLVLYWLKHVRGLEILAESQQVREGDKTIGEVDLIFGDEAGRLTHWEVAVKFYLYLPELPKDDETSLGSHFIGPNAADTFERKMDRLFDHQLELSKTHFPDVEVRMPFVKGRIFYPASHSVPESLPQRLSPDHATGVWIRASHLKKTLSVENASYKVLRKPHWLSSEVSDAKDGEVFSGEKMTQKLKRHFARHDRPVLLSERIADAEARRMFVVSDRWPS